MKLLDFVERLAELKDEGPIDDTEVVIIDKDSGITYTIQDITFSGFAEGHPWANTLWLRVEEKD